MSYAFSVINLAVAMFLVWLRPRDWVARLMAVGMVGTGAVFNLQSHTALDVVSRTPLEFVDVAHENFFHVVAGWAYMYALLVFPDGRLPRWSGRPVLTWLVRIVALFVLLQVGFIASDFHGQAATGFITFFGVVIPVAGVASQAYRYRHAATIEERQQSRALIWVLLLVFAAALSFFAVTGALQAVGRVSQQTIDELAFRVIPPAITVVPVALFVVILRYRLWDIDRVIHRILLYGALAGFITAVYLGIVVGIGTAVGTTGGANVALSILATALVAVAFQPVRERLQRIAARLVYGKRASPYEVMADFSRRMVGSFSLEEVLPGVAEAAARGWGRNGVGSCSSCRGAESGG